MVIRKPRYDAEEYARRGGEIFERLVRPMVRPEHESQFVAIDIESGDFEFDGDDFAASERLLKRVPDAQIWIARIGHPAAYRIGSRIWMG